MGQSTLLPQETQDIHINIMLACQLFVFKVLHCKTITSEVWKASCKNVSNNNNSNNQQLNIY